MQLKLEARSWKLEGKKKGSKLEGKRKLLAFSKKKANS